MPSADETAAPVQAKAIMFDSETMTSLWMNESALSDLSDHDAESIVGLSLVEAIPLADILGLPQGVELALTTREPQHLRARLVSTTQGSLAIVASVYPLDRGELLVLIENAWEPRHRSAGADADRKARPRGTRRKQ